MFKMESDFSELSNAIKAVSKTVSRELRKELTEVAKAVALKTREKVPSGMKKGASGISWGFYGQKGAYIKAGGRGAPKSWPGAYDGARRKSTFRHPVHPTGDRITWNWASQKTDPILEDTWDEMKTWAVLKSEEAIQRAWDKTVGLSDE